MSPKVRKLVLDIVLSCEEIETFTKDKAFDQFIGDRISHGYDVIDDASLWDFVRNRVPELLQSARNYCVE